MTDRKNRSWVAAAAALAGIAVFGSVLAIQTRSFSRIVEAMAEDDIRVRTEYAAAAIAPLLEAGDEKAIREFCDRKRAEGIRATIVDRDGSVLYDTGSATGNHLSREEIHHAFTGEHGTVLRRSETLGTYQLYCARKAGGKVIRLAVPYSGVHEPVRLARSGLLVAGLVGAFAVALIAIVTKKLAGRIDEQNRELAAADANERFRREFTANVAHELKTPLTAIVGAIEMIGDGTDLENAEREELMEIVREQAGRLNSLVKDVLSLAQIEREQGEGRREFTEVPLEKIVETVASIESSKAKRAHVTIGVKCEGSVTVNGDPHLIETAIVNLVENALRYSGTDRIDISVSSSEGMASVSVIDYGIGIPGEHLPHIFNRFYRVDKARSRSLGGTGLGLAIVKHIAKLHGGNAVADSIPGDRTVFTITIPVRTV